MRCALYGRTPWLTRGHPSLANRELIGKDSRTVRLKIEYVHQIKDTVLKVLDQKWIMYLKDRVHSVSWSVATRWGIELFTESTVPANLAWSRAHLLM
jgi:hypothetical protein